MFEIRSYLLLFLSSVLVGSVSSSQDSPQTLDVFPVPFTEGRREPVFLGVTNNNLTNKGSTSCASSVPPFGETGTLETMPGPWELRLMMPEFHKLLTGGAKTVEIDLVFGDATCGGVQESATEVELIQSTQQQQQQGAVLVKDPPPLITMSSCYLKINLEINISASPNWEGGEEPIFVLEHDLNFSTGAESVYEFQPCFSYLTFNNENDVEINYRKPCPSDDGRFLQETGASCSSPHNQTSAPISDPPSIAPSTSTSVSRFQHYGAMMVTGFAIMIAFLS